MIAAEPTERTVPAAGTAAALAVAAWLLATGGCIPSQKLPAGAMDRYWTLTDTSSWTARPHTAPAAGARPSVPRRWVIRQQAGGELPADIAAVREMLGGAGGEVELAVSPAEAKRLADVLARARLALRDLEDIVEHAGGSERSRWAGLLAAALVKIEEVRRAAGGEHGGRGGPEPFGGQAMLNMLAGYLDRRSGGALLSDLTEQEDSRLSNVLVEVVLKLGFDLAGKQPPGDLRGQVAELLRTAPQPAEVQAELAALLDRRLGRAPLSARAAGTRRTLRLVLAVAPRAVGMMESLLNQWDRMDRIAVDLGGGGPTVTLAVRPRREVRIEGVMVGLPIIAFRGTTKVLVRGEADEAGETVVAFEPQTADGAVELLFEGAIYGLVRLLAVPLASGALREVRTFRSSPPEGEQIVNVKVLMEALGRGGDRRRMIVVQDARTRRIVRTAFAVGTVTESSDTTFSYLTPDRRYTYQRTKDAGAGGR